MIPAIHQAPTRARIDGPPHAITPPAPADPIEDESESFNQAAWDEWYRERIRRSLSDPRLPMPHAEVIELACQVINELEARHAQKVA